MGGILEFLGGINWNFCGDVIRIYLGVFRGGQVSGGLGCWECAPNWHPPTSILNYYSYRGSAKDNWYLKSIRVARYDSKIQLDRNKKRNIVLEAAESPRKQTRRHYVG